MATKTKTHGQPERRLRWMASVEANLERDRQDLGCLVMKANQKSARLRPVKNLRGRNRTKFAIAIKSAKEIGVGFKALLNAAWAET